MHFQQLYLISSYVYLFKVFITIYTNYIVKKYFIVETYNLFSFEISICYRQSKKPFNVGKIIENINITVFCLFKIRNSS